MDPPLYLSFFFFDFHVPHDLYHVLGMVVIYSCLQVDICCFDKTGTLTSDDMVSLLKFRFLYHLSLYLMLLNLCFVPQEFSGVGGLTDGEDLETEVVKVPDRTLEILASCHALVFVDNKLV